jgi:replication initiation protein RepC
LSVLRALISFLPKTASNTDALIVWPSNRSLCERADGLDERTLRRHLCRLVNAGLIHRHSSSNGKRFALRQRKTVVTAFGFDLRPLHENADDIAAAAQVARSQTEECCALRSEILNLLHNLNQAEGSLAQEEDKSIRRMLRRRFDLKALVETRDKLLKVQRETSHSAVEVTARDRQIDRHQQKTKEDSYDSVCRKSAASETLAQIEEGPGAVNPTNEAEITLDVCLDATTESRSFAQEPVRSWTDFIHLADRLGPMIGIGRELADHARRAMGPLQAAISILCVIQRSRHIHRPAAYLRKLAALAEQGKYSLKSLIRSAQRERFATVNPIPT